MKQHLALGKRVFDIEALRLLLGVGGSYANYNNFKRRVLEPAIRECNTKTDLNIKVKEVKTGKKITHLSFRIRRQVRVEKLYRAAKVRTCWSKVKGSCAATWSNHNNPKNDCYTCWKFDTKRKEQEDLVMAQ